MNRQVMFVLAAVGFGLLLSGRPVAAQNLGNGTFGIDICTSSMGIVLCPTVMEGSQDPNILGACVSFANVCMNSGKTLTPQLFESCCTKCVQFTDLCGIPHMFCADANSGFPLNCDVQ